MSDHFDLEGLFVVHDFARSHNTAERVRVARYSDAFSFIRVVVGQRS
jgi:hypothetical protein